MQSTNIIPVAAPTTTRTDRPWIFGLLIAPSAVVANGVIQGGVLTFLLTKQGMKIDAASHWITLIGLPTTLYFLYSPLTDFLVKRRTWLIFASFIAAALMFAAFRQPTLAESRALWLIFASGCISQLIVSSCGGMMGTLHTDRAKHTASGFYQAGSMAFGALATWLLIRESSRVALVALGWMAAVSIALPSLFALLAPPQPELRTDGFLATLQVLGRECRATFARWDAAPYLLFMLLPAGTGAAIGLLPGIAQNYGISGDQVAWMNGLLGALAIAAGSMITPLVPSRWPITRVALAVYIANALLLIAMACGPVRSWNYLAGTIAYLFTTGCCYSCGTAVLLEFLGASGKSGSGRYSVMNGLLNVPVLTMISVDGWAAARWGARGLPAIEGAAALATCVPMLIYVCMRPPRRTVIDTEETWPSGHS